MKRLLAFVIALLLVFTLIGCNGQESSSAPPVQTTKPVPGETTGADPEPSGDDEIDWNNLSDEELYEMAKEEGGIINVYAGSGKMLKTGKAFLAKYPDLKLEVYDLDQDEAKGKIKTENETGNITADVLHTKDTAGEIYYDYLPMGYIETYYPTDLVANIPDNLLTYGLPFYSSMNLWYYNNSAFPDGCPLDNWWDIVHVKEDGTPKWKLITKNLGSETAYIALLSSFAINSDQMAAAYEDYYGEPITYTYDAELAEVEANNAGFEFIWRLSQHPGLTFIEDGDEIVQAVHFAYEEGGEHALGFASASKLDNRDDGYNIEWVTGLAPYTAMMNCNYMYVISGCDNPAGARLFIRFQMSKEGFDSSFNALGNWPVDSTLPNEENPFTMAEFGPEVNGAITPDIEALYDIFLDAQDSWIHWYDMNPNK